MMQTNYICMVNLLLSINTIVNVVVAFAIASQKERSHFPVAVTCRLVKPSRISSCISSLSFPGPIKCLAFRFKVSLVHVCQIWRSITLHHRAVLISSYVS